MSIVSKHDLRCSHLESCSESAPSHAILSIDALELQASDKKFSSRRRPWFFQEQEYISMSFGAGVNNCPPHTNNRTTLLFQPLMCFLERYAWRLCSEYFNEEAQKRTEKCIDTIETIGCCSYPLGRLRRFNTVQGIHSHLQASTSG